MVPTLPDLSSLFAGREGTRTCLNKRFEGWNIMTEDSPNASAEDPFSASGSEGRPFGQDAAHRGRSTQQETDASSLALEMAQVWVEEHQKASMLGAFAVGVFVGALLRK